MGCRRVAPASSLARVVHCTADHSLHIDRLAPGRGAWLCAGSTSCLDQAIRRQAFDRALRTTISAQASEALRREVEATSRSGTIDFVPPGSGARD